MTKVATRNTTCGQVTNELRFLWLELTNKCDLECVHCYSDSSPTAEGGHLSVENFRQALTDARDLGCTDVQFIGGEPTLSPFLVPLIEHASMVGFDFIEVYSNLTHLSDALVECFVRNRVRVATSIYSDQAEIHDTITTRCGSWKRSSSNVQRLLSCEVSVRASIIEMDENARGTEQTTQWLQGLGVARIGVDRARPFGRGTDCESGKMSDLCGNCAGGTLCIGSDGTVAPCIMSKAWAVGTLASDSLSTLVRSGRLLSTRQAIHDATGGPLHAASGRMPARQQESLQPRLRPVQSLQPQRPLRTELLRTEVAPLDNPLRS